MRLVIDSGNTLVKAAIFDGDQLRHKVEFDKDSILNAGLSAEYQNVTAVAVSDVSNMSVPLIECLPVHIPVLRVSGRTPVPVKVDYLTPETLGTDRLAGVVYGASLFPGRNILVIQAGTCFTYDLLTENNEYAGGAISPGLDMKLRALNTFTARLPLFDKEVSPPLLGCNTKESILSGVINGSVAEIDGMINSFRSKLSNLEVILGGGDMPYFDKEIKNHIVAVDNLVLKGLNLILEYNVKLEK